MPIFDANISVYNTEMHLDILQYFIGSFYFKKYVIKRLKNCLIIILPEDQKFLDEAK